MVIFHNITFNVFLVSMRLFKNMKNKTKKWPMPNFWAVVYQYIMQYGIICIYLQFKLKSKTLRTKSKFIMELSVHIHTVKRLPRKLFQYQAQLFFIPMFYYTYVWQTNWYLSHYSLMMLTSTVYKNRAQGTVLIWRNFVC